MNKKYKNIGKFLLLAVLALVIATSAEAKGKKFGLFVGINEYPEPISQLAGCVNDVNNMRNAMVTQFGFMKPDTTIMTDAQATRQGIINQINAYEKKAGAGDLFVFHYSGHGTLFPDANSEEQDETVDQYVAVTQDGVTEVYFPRGKYDSAIVPFDVSDNTSGKPWENLILDDELYMMFKKFTDKGVQVVFISDSCHSGTVARAGKTNIPVRFTPLHKALGAKSYADLKLEKPKTSTKVTTAPQMSKLYVAMTGSRDNEFSLDGGGDSGERMGLFTSTLLKTLKTKGANLWTYEKLMSQVSPMVSKVALALENDQNPNLDTRYGNGKMRIFSVPSAKGKGGK